MKEILNLKILDKKLSRRWDAILSSDENSRLRTIADYLYFLMRQYEVGVLGYVIYPYYVTSLLAIDGMENCEELSDILDLAANLEILDSDSRASPKDRLSGIDKLSKLIEDFADKYM